MKSLLTMMFLAFSVGVPSLLAQDDTEYYEVKKRKKKKKKKKKKKYRPSYYSSLGLGKTLPAGYYRFRGITRISQGTTGFDSEGNTLDQGLDLNVLSHGFVTEYGMSENLSFQLLIPYISKNSLGFNSSRFKESSTYKAIESEYRTKLAGLMISQNLCTDAATCLSQPLSANLPLPLPTGEVATLPQGVAPEAVIPSLITNGAEPADGSTGIGDIDFGILYTFTGSETSMFSIGGGLRIPVGSFEDVPSAQRPTGEGMMQGAIRLVYDLHPHPSLWFSIQNQSEFSLVDGRRTKSSLLDPNTLNTEDPTSAIAIAAGSDGESNDQVVTRKRVTNLGMVRVDLGLAKLGQFFQPIAIETSFKYKFGAETYYNDVIKDLAPEYTGYGFGLKYDGLGLKNPFPGYFKVSTEQIISGKNIPIAPSSVMVEFSLYQSF